MELVVIAVVVLIAIIYFGFDSSLESGARMANRKVERLEAQQISEDVRWYNKNTIGDTEFANAVQQKELIKTYRSM